MAGGPESKASTVGSRHQCGHAKFVQRFDALRLFPVAGIVLDATASTN